MISSIVSAPGSTSLSYMVEPSAFMPKINNETDNHLWRGEVGVGSLEGVI